MIDPFETTGWMAAGKSGLDLLRLALTLLPRTAEKERIRRTLDEAERSLELASAKLARDLGYPLCRCVFPPKPMLWNRAKGAFVCAGCAREEGGCGAGDRRT